MTNRLRGLDERDFLTILLGALPEAAVMPILNAYGSLRASLFRKNARYSDYYRGYREITEHADPLDELLRKYHDSRMACSVAAALVSRCARAGTNSWIKVDGYEHVEAARQGGCGAVLMSAHIGSGGLPAAWLVRQGCPVYTVRFPSVRKHSGTIHADHAFFGTTPMFVDWGEAPAAVLKRGMAALRENAVISFLADGSGGGRSVGAKVFGRDFSVRTGFLEVARLARAPIIPAFGLPLKDGFHIRFLSPERIATQEDIPRIAERYAVAYEGLLREYPQLINWTTPQKIVAGGARVAEEPARD